MIEKLRFTDVELPAPAWRCGTGWVLRVCLRSALELEAEPRTGVGDPRIVGRQISVRHVVDEPRHADARCQLITEFEASPKQRRRAELLAVRRSAVCEAILQSAPKTGIGEQTAAPPEQVLDQGDAPSQAEIAVVGIAR